MVYEVNVTENVEWLEVYPEEALDQGRLNPEIVEGQLKLQMRQQLKELLEKALEWEALEAIGAKRYERGAEDRQDYRNGYRQRSLGTSMGTVALRVPRGRKPLNFEVFEAYQRRWQELDQLLLEAHIGGMSCRDVGERLGGLLGSACSGATVSRLKSQLAEQLRSFQHEPIKDEYVALVVDGMYVRVKQCGERKRPVIVVIGIREDGREDLLSLRLCYSENSTEVEGMLRSLKERGLRGQNLQLVTLDGDKGLEAAVYAVFGHVRIQDCVFHRVNRLHANAKSKNRGRWMMKEASKAFAHSDARKQRRALKRFCQKWREKEPLAIQRFETGLERSMEVQSLPPDIRSRASTTGACENLFKQLRARIKRIGAFESPRSLELYVYAIICQKKWIRIPGRPDAAPLLGSFTHLC